MLATPIRVITRQLRRTTLYGRATATQDKLTVYALDSPDATINDLALFLSSYLNTNSDTWLSKTTSGNCSEHIYINVLTYYP